MASWIELERVRKDPIEALREKGRTFVTGGQMGWFKRICKQLNEMEEYM